MSLRIWLPLNGDLHNQGLTKLPEPVANTLTYSAGKISQCGTGRAAWHLAEDFLGNTWSVAMWVRPTALGSNNNVMLCKNVSGSSDCQIYFSIISTTQLNIGVNGPSSSLKVTGPAFTDQWYHVAATYDGNTVALYLNGEQKGTKTVTTAMPTGRLNLTLNGRSSNAAGTGVTGGATFSFNDVRIYDNCLSAAEVKEIAQGLILHYKLDGINNASVLPLQYQQLEYIESTGTSYFNTGYKFNAEIDSCKVIFKGNDTSNNGMIFASQGTKYFWFYYYGSNGIRVYANNGSDGQKSITGISSDLIQHTMEFKNKTYYIDNINKGSLTNTYTDTTNNIWLFSYNNNGYPFKGRIYYVEIKKNNQYQRIFIPAKRLNDSAIGMYDLITNAFYTSDNVAFTAGPEVGTLTIQDGSGYNHTAEIIGNLAAENDSIRYLNNIYIENGTQQYIRSPVLYLPQDAITLNIWFKSTNTAPTGNYHMIIDSNANRQWYEMTVHNTGYFRAGLFVNGTRYADNGTSKTCLNGNWHMLTLTYDGATIKRYVDSVMEKSTSVAISTGLSSPTALTIGRDGPSASYACKQVSLNDFRIYATALTENDIINLYKTSMFVDNKANILPFEINENEANTINSQGVLNDNIIEPFITLSDGSRWQLLLFHKVDGGTRLFTSSNATYCNDYGLFSRLAYVNNFTYNNQYEFYVIQDGTEFRWTQTSQPTAASIAGKTVVEGYNDPVNGLAKANQSNTYIGYGSWWGACGCYNSYTQSGKTGIPGFGPHSAAGICTDYLALYARIEEPHVYIEEFSVQAEEFIER